MSVPTVLDVDGLAHFDVKNEPAHRPNRTAEGLMVSEMDDLLTEALLRSGASPTEGDQTAQKAVRQKSREQRLYVYLGGLRDTGKIDGYTAIVAWRMWRQLRRAAKDKVRVPNASASGEGQVLYTWNEEEHHLELEIFPDGKAEFFYRNRRTGKLWGHDLMEGEAIPQDIIQKATLFPHV